MGFLKCGRRVTQILEINQDDMSIYPRHMECDTRTYERWEGVLDISVYYSDGEKYKSG
jgi:hypothetical protein